MACVPAQDDMAWKRASTGRGSMPPQKTSFEPHARQPDSFRKPRQGDLILFSQISSIRNEGRHEARLSQWPTRFGLNLSDAVLPQSLTPAKCFHRLTGWLFVDGSRDRQ